MAEPAQALQKERPLRESIRDALRARVFDGHYAPGTRLVERDLAAEFNVSRLPVREALRMLVQEGALAERASRGAVVATLSDKDVADLFSLRLSLEVLACRLAAERADAVDIARLDSLLARASDSLARGSINEAHRANGDFHDEVTRIADNDFLRTALEPLRGRMRWIFRHATNLPELIQEHRDLLTAIASGDPDRAAAQSAIHVAKYRDQYTESL